MDISAVTVPAGLNLFAKWIQGLTHVVLNSVDMAYRDEDRILDSIYRKQNIFEFYYEYLKFFRVIEENAYLQKYSTAQQGSRKIKF